MFKILLSIAILAGFEIRQSTAGLCKAAGDPHYKTFDDETFDFQGHCQYLLAKVDQKFTVLAKNTYCGGSRRVTCTSEVKVKVKKLEIVLKRRRIVTVFGTRKTLPYSKRGVNIRDVNGIVKVNTDIGLTVEFNGGSDAYIYVTNKYRGKTRGICGNFDGIQNGFLKSDGVVTRNSQDFANSWKVDQSCTDASPRPNPCLTASPSKVQIAKRKCSLLKRQPFAECHSEIDVQEGGFIHDCKYDVCGCKKHPRLCLCEEYSDYVTTCGFVGVNIEWKHLAAFKHCKNRP